MERDDLYDQALVDLATLKGKIEEQGAELEYLKGFTDCIVALQAIINHRTEEDKVCTPSPDFIETPTLYYTDKNEFYEINCKWCSSLVCGGVNEKAASGCRYLQNAKFLKK